MFDWLQGPGRGLRHPLKGSTNYLSAYDSRGQLTRLRDKDEDKDPNTPTSRRQEGSDAEVGPIREREGTRSLHENGGKEEDALPPERSRDLRPYPLNSHFKSQPVLSEDLREEIWRRVQEAGVNIKVVSAELGVSIERVGAVVRMKEVEKRWLAEGKPLATPYSRAVLSMLPTTPFDPSRDPIVHESINDLRVHPYTKQQVFVPVSESRHFTRKDAGEAFHNDFLPTESRIPHPELVALEKDRRADMPNDELIERARIRLEKEAERRQKREDERKRKIAETVRVVNPGKRFAFRFEECKVDAEVVGKDGRGHKGVGHRYGMPHEDRKKGQIKIPTYVL